MLADLAKVTTDGAAVDAAGDFTLFGRPDIVLCSKQRMKIDARDAFQR